MTSAVSKDWKSLNASLREADEATCWQLLRAEHAGAGRSAYLLRIHSRLNKVRAARERKALQAGEAL